MNKGAIYLIDCCVKHGWDIETQIEAVDFASLESESLESTNYGIKI